MRKLVFLATLLAPLSANADLMMMGTSGRAAGASGYIGPGSVQAYTAFWSLRAYNNTKCTGSIPALRLRRASDSTEQDVNILTSCELDIASATTFCAATTCFARTVYDQTSGNACTSATCDIQWATAANQPTFVFNCIGTRPCLQTNTAAQGNTSTNFTPSTGVASLHVVSAWVSGGTNANAVAINGGAASNRILALFNDARMFQVNGGTSGTLPAPTGGTPTSFNIGVGVIDGANSVANRNGLEATGTVTGNTTAGIAIFARGATTSVYRYLEGGFVDAVVLSPSQRQSLVTQARGYWGF